MTMTRVTGSFIWYELMTTDTKAAGTFYSNVLGWNVKAFDPSDSAYLIASVGPVGVGGIMTLPQDARAAGVPPCWMNYVGVDDVDTYVARVKQAGGSVMKEPWDIPGVGRIAVCSDPDGAAFHLMTPASSEPQATVAPGTPGHVGWRELHAGNGEAAFQFYAGLFGWSKGDAMDMGPQGVYQLFSTGEAPIGGMMTKLAETPVPHWLFYFNVDGLDAAVARARAGNGKILMEQHQVPTGQWIAVCADPQGAAFGLLAGRR